MFWTLLGTMTCIEPYERRFPLVRWLNRFLRGMVRGLVATQLRIAKNKGTADELRAIIEAQNCTKAFFNVAGHGLYLEEIVYPEGTFFD